MILAAGLDSASVLIMFGAMQIFTGLRYGIPMPVQPLKAMAALVIAQKLSGGVLFGGGLVVGLIMLVLTVTGLIEWLARVVPKTVVRGIQFGLGLQLALLALKDYVQADGAAGYALAAAGFVIIIALMGNRRFPAALFVIALGMIYAFVFKIDLHTVSQGAGFSPPPPAFAYATGFAHRPGRAGHTADPVVVGKLDPRDATGRGGFFPRAAPDHPGDQLHLLVDESGQSMVWRRPDVPWLGGNGRTLYIWRAHGWFGPSVYGSLYLTLGLFFSGCFAQWIQIFPKPILGVLLAFEGLAMLLLVRDIAGSKGDLLIAHAGWPDGRGIAKRIRDRIDCRDGAGLCMASLGPSTMKP